MFLSYSINIINVINVITFEKKFFKGIKEILLRKIEIAQSTDQSDQDNR